MKKHISFIFIFLLAIIPVLPLLHNGLPITHDGQDHVARIANFYKNLEEGNVIPRWASFLNWGYGHPILMFLYPLPSYMAALFKFIGFSFQDSTKIVFAASYILSGFTMFFWIRKAYGDKPALVASLLYTYAPYRFVDMYVRGAIGEHVAFVFPPLICYFLYSLKEKASYKSFLGAALSLGGLILAHNAISLIFLPLLILYAFYLTYQIKDKRKLFLVYVSVLFVGLGLSAFFWVPAFFEGKYTLRDIVTATDYASRFVPIHHFIFREWSFGGTDLLSKEVGLVHLALLIVTVWVLPKMNNKEKRSLLGVLIVLCLLSLFIMTSYSKTIWDAVTTLQKFQFPWRFLSITVFLFSLLGGVLFSVLSSKTQKMLLLVIVFLTVLISIRYIRVKDYLHKPESFYTGIYRSTTDTGESSPIWSVRFMEKTPKTPIEVLSGRAEIKYGKRTSTEHVYTITVVEKARLRENTVYFPGWFVLSNNKSVPVEFQDPSSRGLQTFWLDKGIHEVKVQFTETKLRMFANSISAGSVLLLLLLAGFIKMNIWQCFR